jgi:hypothetical protein
MNKRSAVIALLAQFTGQQNVLTIPRALINVCGGDIPAALLLSQILYWSDRTTDPDGWFAKSYDDWNAEISMTEYQIKRAIKGDKRRKNGGLRLADIGVETKLSQSKYYSNAPTMHYRIDAEKLHAVIVSSLNLNIVQDGNRTLSRMDTEQSSESIYIDTETTTETTKDSAADAAPAPKPKRKSTPRTLDNVKPLQAVVAYRAFGVQRQQVITGTQMTRVNTILKELRERWQNGDAVEADELKAAFMWHTSGRGERGRSLDAPRDAVKVAAMVADYRDEHGAANRPAVNPDCPVCNGLGKVTNAATGADAACPECAKEQHSGR